MFGGDGNDRMIWNPGDGTDLMEGGPGSDVAEVQGGNGAEVFTIQPNGTRVRFDRVDPAPFALDIGTTETLLLLANGGNDLISATGGLAALIGLTIDGGAGDDTILSANGADVLVGGDGNDFVDGNQGNDVAFLGAGADIFQWDPGDGNDTVEGQSDIDTLLFNGSAGNEVFTLSANGARTRLQRDLGVITMDVNDVETVHHQCARRHRHHRHQRPHRHRRHRASPSTSPARSAARPAMRRSTRSTVHGTGGADTIDVLGIGTFYSVLGLAASGRGQPVRSDRPAHHPGRWRQ